MAQAEIATGSSLTLPSGNADNKFVTLSAKQSYTVSIGDEENRRSVALPAGTSNLWNAPRQCGDWTCFITINGVERGHFAPTQEQAFLGLLSQVSA